VGASFGRRRSIILSFGGPLVIVSLIAFWALGLAVGAALLIRPELETSIQPGAGETPTDFVGGYDLWPRQLGMSAKALPCSGFERPQLGRVAALARRRALAAAATPPDTLKRRLKTPVAAD